MKLTVLLTTYNGEKYLKETLRSILDQTWKGFKLIIADDGSTDGTKDIIACYPWHLFPIPVYIDMRERNIGQTKLLNQKLQEVNTPYLARIDQDDLWKPDKLERQMQIMESDSRLGAVGTWYKAIDGEGNKLYNFRPPINHDELLNCFTMYNPFAHSSLVFRTDAVRECGGYPKDRIYGQDFPLVIRIAKSKEVLMIPDELTSIRFHSDQQGAKGRRKSWEMVKSIGLALWLFKYPIYRKMIGIGTMGLYLGQWLFPKIPIVNTVKKMYKKVTKW